MVTADDDDYQKRHYVLKLSCIIRVVCKTKQAKGLSAVLRVIE